MHTAGRGGEAGREGGREEAGRTAQVGPPISSCRVDVVCPNTPHTHVFENKKDIATPITKQPGETGFDCCVEIRTSKKEDTGTSFNSNQIKIESHKLAEYER